MEILKKISDLRKAVSNWHKQKDISQALTLGNVNYGELLEPSLTYLLEGYTLSKIEKKNPLTRVLEFFLGGITPDQSDVLIFLSSTLRVTPYSNIISELKQRNLSFSVIAGNLGVKLALAKRGISSELLVISEKPDSTINPEKIISLLPKNISYKDKDIKPLIAETIDKHLPLLITASKEVEKLFEKKKPRAILLENDTTELTKLIVSVARKNNVHSFVLQHGLIANPAAYVPIFADKMLVWGKKDKQLFSQLGYNNTIPTGNPSFDKPQKENKSLRVKLKISEQEKIILITTTKGNLSEEAYKPFIEELLKEISSLDYSVIIKVHPLEDISFYNSLSSSYPRIKVVENQRLKNFFSDSSLSASTLDLINLSDILISNGSTSIIEAIALNKPAIFCDSGVRHTLTKATPFIAESVKDLPNLIKKISSLSDSKLDKARKKVIEEYLYALDRKASRRIVDTLNNAIKKA